MTTLITVIHILICFILILAVLLQSGKAADLAGAFGGGGSQTVFGPRGAGNILSKVTTICAILFMLTSLGLWILSAKGTSSVVKGGEDKKKEAAAATETKKDKKESQPPASEEKQSQQTKKETEKEKKN